MWFLGYMHNVDVEMFYSIRNMAGYIGFLTICDLQTWVIKFDSVVLY